ncbi:MAG: type II secretion system protein [Planctomycetota bacterium]|jgi:Tfp pilus assembly protein PilX
MKRTRRQKGFILLLVIALIPLLGVASIVLTANSRQILTNTRRAALKTHARLARESGIAWLEKNKTTVSKDQPLVLEIRHENKTIICTIELASQTDSQLTFTVTGGAEDKRFSYERSQQFVLKR